MKEFKSQKRIMQVLMLIGTFAFFALASCSKDDDEEPAADPVASFQYEISEDNFLEVSFMNFSQNAETYNWNFGDGNSSTEENPTHIYDEEGNYTVELIATNIDGVSRSFSEVIELQDPFEALTLLAGETSKTWRLYRIDQSMGIGETLEDPYAWWFLENDGSRPCKYLWEYTFTRDMEYIFDDNGVFWAEYEIWGGVDGYEDTPQYEDGCFEAIPENMVNVYGDDVSAWLSGTHQFEYDPSTNTVTLIGEGAWIGLSKLGTDGHHSVPQNSVSFKIDIEERDGYDHMAVTFEYDWGAWQFNYASYSDPSLEPEVVTEQEEVPDLEPITPTALGHTFESAESFELLGEIDGGVSVITPGVDDPEDAGATKVGKLERTDAQYQEAQLRVSPEPKNIQYDNFTTVSLDVYLPSGNDYDPLTRKLIIGFGDVHTTTEWWNRLIQHESDELALDEWVTVTFELDSPSFSSTDGETVYDREDLDMVYIQIGGGGHTTPGVFYIRNLIFE